MLEDTTAMATENTEQSEHSMQTDAAPPGEDALDAFWVAHRLLHVKSALSHFLGTETFSDLDDVRPCDLETTHAQQQIRVYLNIAEAARLRRAVAAHHAEKHPQPLPGALHLPRCRRCSCQGGDATATGPPATGH